jgi:hypothetical protein
VHQLVFHGAPRLCEELDAEVGQQLLGQSCRNIASISKDFAKQLLQQLRHWLAVIGIARGNTEIEQFSVLIEPGTVFKPRPG